MRPHPNIHLLRGDHFQVPKGAAVEVEGAEGAGFTPVVNPQGEDKVTLLGDLEGGEVSDVRCRTLVPVTRLGKLLLGDRACGPEGHVVEVNDCVRGGIGEGGEVHSEILPHHPREFTFESEVPGRHQDVAPEFFTEESAECNHVDAAARRDATDTKGGAETQ